MPEKFLILFSLSVDIPQTPTLMAASLIKSTWPMHTTSTFLKNKLHTLHLDNNIQKNPNP